MSSNSPKKGVMRDQSPIYLVLHERPHYIRLRRVYSKFDCIYLVQIVLDVQLNSLKTFNASSFSEDVGVHPVTARFATLTASLLLLNSDFKVRATRSLKLLCILNKFSSTSSYVHVREQSLHSTHFLHGICEWLWMASLMQITIHLLYAESRTFQTVF